MHRNKNAQREMEKIMGNIFYKPENAWVGDLIPYYENGTYFAFYLHDPRNRKDEFAEDTTWHLVTTKNFLDLTYHGEAIHPGGADKPDRNAYTGSVIRDDNGICYAFFTAFNEDIKIDGESVQSVMRAKGTDPYHLETDREFLFAADDKIYESFDWRDPYVFFHEKEQCWWMLLAARRKNAGGLRGGCIALCKSKDLTNWTYEQPFFDPHMYVTMECPEVFQMGNYWYLVFSTFNEKFVTHYRIADSLEGPWRIPDDDVFDTRANYAIKTVSDGNRRFACGWIASKKGNCDFGPWEWGGTMVFHEVIQNPENGELHIKQIDAYGRFYQEKVETSNPILWNCRMEEKTVKTEMLGAFLYDVPKDAFSLEMQFEILKAHEFGIALHASDGLETGYFLKMNDRTGEMAWDQWPRAVPGKYQWQIKGDIPYQLETVRRLPTGPVYRVKILREGSICIVYVNDEVALSTRMYDHNGQLAGLFLVQGAAKFTKFELKIR